jgi:hypothetical protein
MNDLSTQPDKSRETPEGTAGSRLGHVGAHFGNRLPSLPAHGLRNCDRALRADLVGDAALPVYPNDLLNAVNQIIVCDVGIRTQVPDGPMP